ncbi:hypothetical protein BHE74_00052084, partial [Ensete ventricosum]
EFAEGIRKLAKNTLGDRWKKIVRLAARMPKAIGLAGFPSGCYVVGAWQSRESGSVSSGGCEKEVVVKATMVEVTVAEEYDSSVGYYERSLLAMRDCCWQHCTTRDRCWSERSLLATCVAMDRHWLQEITVGRERSLLAVLCSERSLLAANEIAAGNIL